MAGYIGTTPVPQATQHRESFTATGGQTSFATVGYTPQFIDVYLNGVKLAPADFTATNGSDVVLASGATASDILEIVAYTPFEVANQTFTGTTTAANLTVTGAFTSQGIDDNANAVAITIDSSENVGIGHSPTYKVDVSGTNPALRLKSSAAFGYIIDQNTSSGLVSHIVYENVDMRFGTNSTERMRITSAGTVTVGKTAEDIGTAGHAFAAQGYAFHTRSGNTPLFINRLTSDGTLAEFRKDGSTVGSISTLNGMLAIGNNNVFLNIDGGAGDYIYPMSSASGGASDGNVTLGFSSRRFKDFYLSGTAYVDTAVEIHAGNSLKMQNVAGNGFATIQNAGAGTNTDLSFNTAGSERMRIDSSGNLLVGKTTTAFGTQGVRLSTVGSVLATSDGNAPAELNRLSSDGDILGFYKDGSTVGSIGVEGNDITIDGGVSNHSGLRFSSPAILPRYNGALADNAVDLGQTSSNYRFKDLYLSGGVFLGGTGSANKLEDYEEGTWTPTVNGITVTGNHGRYRKIGSFVIAAYAMTFPSSSNTGRIQIQGLPFTNMNDGAGGANIPNFGAALGYTNQGSYFGHHVNNNATTVDAYKLDGTDAQITQWSTKQIRNVIFYFTD